MVYYPVKFFDRAAALARRHEEDWVLRPPAGEEFISGLALPAAEVMWRLRKDDFLGDFFRSAKLHGRFEIPLASFSEFDGRQARFTRLHTQWIRDQGYCCLGINFGHGSGDQYFELLITKLGVVVLQRRLEIGRLKNTFFLQQVVSGHIEHFLNLVDEALQNLGPGYGT